VKDKMLIQMLAVENLEEVGFKVDVASAGQGTPQLLSIASAGIAANLPPHLRTAVSGQSLSFHLRVFAVSNCETL
jgi:hypothetical protein